MPRKKPTPSKDDNVQQWRDLLGNLKAEGGGDLPWMAKCAVGEIYEMEIDVQSINRHNDAGPEKKWSCYRANGHVEGSVEMEYIEIPFWAMDDFIEIALEKVKESGWAKFTYERRIGKNNMNEAWFE